MRSPPLNGLQADEQPGSLRKYDNAGVVALDVSGIITGKMAGEEIARIQEEGGGNTFTWGVILWNGSVLRAPRLSGFWQVSVLHQGETEKGGVSMGRDLRL